MDGDQSFLNLPAFVKPKVVNQGWKWKKRSDEMLQTKAAVKERTSALATPRTSLNYCPPEVALDQEQPSNQSTKRLAFGWLFSRL